MQSEFGQNVLCVCLITGLEILWMDPLKDIREPVLALQQRRPGFDIISAHWNSPLELLTMKSRLSSYAKRLVAANSYGGNAAIELCNDSDVDVDTLITYDAKPRQDQNEQAWRMNSNYVYPPANARKIISYVGSIGCSIQDSEVIWLDDSYHGWIGHGKVPEAGVDRTIQEIELLLAA